LIGFEDLVSWLEVIVNNRYSTLEFEVGERWQEFETGLEEFLERDPIPLPAERRPSPSGAGGFGFRSAVVSSDRDYSVIWGASCSLMAIPFV
jgi:hypothetical protein